MRNPFSEAAKWLIEHDVRARNRHKLALLRRDKHLADDIGVTPDDRPHMPAHWTRF